MKKRISRRKRRKNEKEGETGIRGGMDKFFVGGEWKIAGFVHIKPPRWTEEYQKMRVRDLVRRIQDDLEELAARAYPNYTAEHHQRFAPKYWHEFPLTYENFLRTVISQSVAEELCPDLWERIISQDKTVSRNACEEYQRVLPQFLESEPRHAVNAVAFVAQKTARYLENLFIKRAALMMQVAAKYDLWPVNLGLRRKTVKGKVAYEVIRQGFGHNYLRQLGLSSNCDFPTSHQGSAESISPFKLAAEDLYINMLLLKDDPDHHVCFPKITPWAKRLFALTVPMTKSNSGDWWKIVKVYLYERWDKAQQEFKPLIKHLGFRYPIELSSKVPYQSIIKSRVIDNDLRDAFVALARPDL